MTYELRKDMRLAGEVSRYHTWPRLKEQSVAEHSWQLLRLLYTFQFDPEPEIVQYIVFHDIGEFVCGDIPYPVKKDNPNLKIIMDTLEEKAFDDMAAEWAMVGLSHKQLTVPQLEFIKLLELIEMFEWGLEQIMMGNSLATPVFIRCFEGICSKLRGNMEDNLTYKNIAVYLLRRIRAWAPADTMRTLTSAILNL